MHKFIGILFAAVLPIMLMMPSAFAFSDPYDQSTFEQLLKDEEAVLVTVHADWCSTCLSQDKVLKALLTDPAYNKLHVLRVDFDTQKEALRFFQVQWQSTLILFKHGREIDRSVADTDRESIARMLDKVL